MGLGSETAQRSTFQVDVTLHPTNNVRIRHMVMVGSHGFIRKRAGEPDSPGGGAGNRGVESEASSQS